jgi:hypothetical protein
MISTATAQKRTQLKLYNTTRKKKNGHKSNAAEDNGEVI